MMQHCLQILSKCGLVKCTRIVEPCHVRLQIRTDALQRRDLARASAPLAKSSDPVITLRARF
jgi:hypothetical protein